MSEKKTVPRPLPRFFRCNIREDLMSEEELVRCIAGREKELVWVMEITERGWEDMWPTAQKILE